MCNGNKKKKWGKPELIILVRGKPEERVLAVCKTGSHADPSILPSYTRYKCETTDCPVCSINLLS